MTAATPTVNEILQHLNRVGRGIEAGALGPVKTLETMERKGLVEMFGTIVYLTPKGRNQIVSTNATVLTVEPGNGTRYVIVHGTDAQGNPFVALPDFKTAATMTPYPAEHGYIQEKLGISEADALIVFNALREA